MAKVSLLPTTIAPRACLAATILIAALCLTAGASQILHQWRDGWREHRAASAVVLVTAGVVQVLLARRMAGDRKFKGLDPQQLRALVLWQGVVVATAYFIGIACGPAPEARYLVRAAIAVGWTLSLADVALPKLHRRLSDWDHIPAVHALAAGLVALCAVLVTGESLLWTMDRVAGIEPTSRVAVRDAKLTPGAEFRGSTVNRLGYWDDEFRAEIDPRVMRVAVLGHDVPLSGDATTNCLAQLERHLPGVEVYNFGLQRSGPREFVAQVEADVLRYRPQLVLAFVNVGDDLLGRAELPRSYDWRSLRTVQWTAHTLRMPLFRASAFEPADSPPPHEQYLHAEANRLAVCRTPIDAAMRERWTDLTRQLRRLVKTCGKYDVPLALVLVPCEFQVSPVLRETLVRRAGCKPEQIDLDLPQRKLANFADEQQVPVIDLLSYFRSSGTNVYVRDRGELNEAGSRLAVQVLGGWLQSRYGSQLAGTN